MTQSTGNDRTAKRHALILVVNPYTIHTLIPPGWLEKEKKDSQLPATGLFLAVLYIFFPRKNRSTNRSKITRKLRSTRYSPNRVSLSILPSGCCIVLTWSRRWERLEKKLFVFLFRGYQHRSCLISVFPLLLHLFLYLSLYLSLLYLSRSPLLSIWFQTKICTVFLIPLDRFLYCCRCT